MQADQHLQLHVAISHDLKFAIITTSPVADLKGSCGETIIESFIIISKC